MRFTNRFPLVFWGLHESDFDTLESHRAVLGTWSVQPVSMIDRGRWSPAVSEQVDDPSLPMALLSFLSCVCLIRRPASVYFLFLLWLFY